MTSADALAALEGSADDGRAAQMAAYHKVARRYLGVPNPVLDQMARDWRQSLSQPDRLALAQALWTTDIFEARIAAAKLLTQARIADDAAIWDVLTGWVPDFDSWAIADAVCTAGAKRVTADRARLDVVEGWTRSDRMWTRRAALVITLPYAKIRHPKPADLAVRERVLGWAAGSVGDAEWFMQKAVAWWLRELSKKDPERTRAFLSLHGKTMAGFARREASKYLPPLPQATDAADTPTDDHSTA